jgi:hypothetical protein
MKTKTNKKEINIDDLVKGGHKTLEAACIVAGCLVAGSLLLLLALIINVV